MTSGGNAQVTCPRRLGRRVAVLAVATSLLATLAAPLAATAEMRSTAPDVASMADDVSLASATYDRSPFRPGPLAPVNGVSPSALALDPSGDFLYVSSGAAPGKINKLRVSDMTVVGTLTLNPGEDAVSAIAVDPSGTFGYAITRTSPTRLVKIRLSNLTRVGAIPLATGSDDGAAIAIDPAGAFAFVVLPTGPGKIAKVRLSDFVLVSTQTLSAGQNSPETLVLDSTGTYGYVATGTSPVIVVKFRLSDLRLEVSGTMNSGENETRAMVIGPSDDFLYLATYTVPSKIVKVNAGTAQRVSAIPLGTDENEVSGAAMDPGGKFAFFAPDSPTGRIVKVAIPTLSRVGALVPPDESDVYSMRSMVVNAAGTIGYLGSNLEGGPVTILPLTGWPGVCGGIPSSYFDIPEGASYERAASCLSRTGVASTLPDGDGIIRYRPESNVTRAQMAAFMWRIPGAVGVAESCGFTDEAAIPPFAREGACWLKVNGITTENPFSPGGLVTRAQMAAFLWRAAGSPAGSSSCGFTDAASIPAYARTATCWMKATGITTINPYRPADPVNRAQMALFLYRIGGVIGRWTTSP